MRQTMQGSARRLLKARTAAIAMCYRIAQSTMLKFGIALLERRCVLAGAKAVQYWQAPAKYQHWHCATMHTCLAFCALHFHHSQLKFGVEKSSSF